MKIPGIYVEIKGDSTQLQKDMSKARQIVTESAKGMSNALNNALSPGQVGSGTKKLIADLGTLQRSSKVTGDTFGKLGVDLGKLQKLTGTTGTEFQKLQARMLQTSAAKGQVAALRNIAKSAGLSSAEIKKMGQQFGLSKAQINAVTGSIDKSGRSFRAFGGVAKTAIAALSVASIASVGRQVLNIADQYTLLESRLRLVTTGAENLTSVQKSLYEISLRTHQGMGGTIELYTRLARSTETLGTSQADLLTITESINKAILVSGANATEAGAALIQLSQGIASGALRGEELNSVMEQTPRLAKAIADGIGVDIGQLRAMAKEGKLTGDVVTKALLSQKNVIEREYYQMTVTVSQAFVDLRTVVESIIAETNKASGATNGIVDAVQDLSQTISENREGIISLFTEIIRLAGSAVEVVGNIGRSLEGLRAVKAGDLSFLEYATSDAEELDAALKKIVPGVSEVNDKLGDLATKRKDVAESWAFTPAQRKAKQDELKAIDESIAALKIEKNTIEAAGEAYSDSWQKRPDTVTAATVAETKHFKTVGGLATTTGETQRKESQRTFDEQSRLAERLTDMMAKESMTQTAYELRELQKRKAADMAAAGDSVDLKKMVTTAYATEEARLTMLVMSGIDKRSAAEWEALDKMEDGWMHLARTRVEADDEAATDIENRAGETTNVIIDEWSNALGSVQSSLADMIYEFDFSMDSILDIFKRMLAEMAAAIIMSGIKDLFLGQFDGFGSLLGGIGKGSSSGLGLTGAATSGLGKLGGGLALAGGAYGLYSGVKSLSKGNIGPGALGVGLGGAAAYQGAVSLGFLESGAFTAAIKPVATAIGLKVGGTAGAIGGSHAGIAAAQSSLLSATPTAATPAAGALSGTYIASQPAAAAPAAGMSGLSPAAMSTAAAAAIPLLASALVVKGIFDKANRPSASAEIDEYGITPAMLGQFSQGMAEVQGSILSTVPTLSKFKTASYDAETGLLTLNKATSSIGLQFDATAQAGHQWSKAFSTSVLDIATAVDAGTQSMENSTGNMIKAVTGIASGADAMTQSMDAMAGSSGSMENAVTSLDSAMRGAASGAGSMENAVSGAASDFSTLGSKAKQAADDVQLVNGRFVSLSDYTKMLSNGLYGLSSAASSAARTTNNLAHAIGDSNENSRGGYIGYAGGGMLQGGSGVKDDLYLGTVNGRPQLAMGREYIINQKSTKKYRAILDLINADTYASGGSVGNMMAGVNTTIFDLTHSDYESSVRRVNIEYDDLIKNLKDAKATQAQLTAAERARSLELAEIDKQRADNVRRLMESTNYGLTTIGMTSEQKEIYDIKQQLAEDIKSAKENGASASQIANILKLANLQIKEITSAKFKDANATLKSFKEQMSGLADETVNSDAAVGKLNNLLVNAKKGNFSGLDKISDILDDIKINKEDYATAADYARAYWGVMSTVGSLETITGRAAGLSEYAGTTGINAKAVFGSGSVESKVVEELRAVKQEIASGNIAIAKSTSKTADSLKRIEYDGLYLDAGNL